MERSQAAERPADRRNTLHGNGSGNMTRRARALCDRYLVKPALLFAGSCHARWRRFDSAVACFARAVAIDPESFAARVRLGTVYWIRREFDEAERQFIAAQRIDPKRFDRSNLPAAYALGGQFPHFGPERPSASTDATPVGGPLGVTADLDESDFEQAGFDKAGFDKAGFDDSGDPTDVDRDPFDFGTSELFEDAVFEDGFELSIFDEETEFLHGDFSSYDEWKRFQSLPPITPEEIRNVDWDRILPDLR